MFDKFKQLKKARDIQNSLKTKEFNSEKEGVSIIIDGTLKIKEIKLNSELNKEKQEEILKDCFNEAMQKAQVAAAQEMSQMGGL